MVIVLACLLVWLILWVEHWFPWEKTIGRKLPRVWAYILGVGAILLTLSGLFLHWRVHEPGDHLLGLWAVVISAGLSVFSAYGIDWLIARIAGYREVSEREDQYLEQAYGIGSNDQ